jgi:hypothetical protein
VTLSGSVDVIVAALAGRRDGAYVRSSALFDQAKRRIEEHSGIAVRDLELIDGTLAKLADFLGVASTDYDTVPAGS